MNPDDLRKRLAALPADQRDLLLKAAAIPRLGGHALVGEALKQCGIVRLSGITGKPVNEIFGEADRHGIRLFGTRHQFTATIMAAIDNHLSDSLCHAVCVSAGPAITNCVTGILHARDNHWPLLALGGRSPVKEEFSGHFQELDAVPIMRSITKWSATISTAGDIIPMIRKASLIAMEDKPGPVYLDIPEDVLYGQARPVNSAPPQVGDPVQPEAGDVLRVLMEVRASERPLLCLGEGLRRGFDGLSLLNLVEHEGIPFVSTPMGRGLLPDNHPACMNSVRKQAMQRADLFIMAGAWFDWRFRMGASVGRKTRIIHIHPDPDQLGRNVKVTHGFRADPMAFLKDLSQVVDPAPVPDREPWNRELHSLVSETEGNVPDSFTPSPGYVDSHSAMRMLRDRMPHDAIVSVDGSLHLTIAQYHLQALEPFSWFDPGWQGLIGGGIPMAMGALSARPDRPSVAVVGDTGFGISGFEFETAVRHRLPVKVVIMNNSGISGLLRQRKFLPEDYPERFSRFQDALPYENVVRALGAEAEAVSSIEELSPALDRMFAAEAPYCLNLHIDPNTPHPPFW